MSLPVAFSPCPNDTFLFHAWSMGLVGQHHPLSPVIADVQHLNEWALHGKYPVSKVSINCVGHILDDYILLPTGCALGHGCGPKIIAAKHFDLNGLRDKRIAIPGADTTANLLFNILIDPTVEKYYCHYEQVTRLIRSGIVDCGLIIHETRFVYEEQGFVEIADLGQLWEDKYQLPLPLGGIVAKRSLGQERLNDLTKVLQASLHHALQNPDATTAYVLEHSIEKDPGVIQQHIDLYVNEETVFLSHKGQASISKLIELAREQDLMPVSAQAWLFEMECPYETR